MAEPGASAASIDDLTTKLTNLTMVQLKEELKRRKLKTAGPKNELVLRLLPFMQLEREHGEAERDDVQDERNRKGVRRRQEDDDESDTDSEEEVIERRLNGTTETRRNQLLTFRDVEESMETFNGDDKIDVKKWLDDFEEMATLCEWSDIQKVVYAKRLLRGSAKLFVNYEKCTKTWKKLRRALKEEFGTVVDSHAVHRELLRRKKTSNESCQAYTYKMLEIAAQADVDVKSVIQYIIEGIQDDAVNKTILHGATTIRELKEKFIQYEAIKKEEKSKTKQPKSDEKKKMAKGDAAAGTSSTETRRCFNCGSRDHLGKVCPMKDKGAKCFKCNQYGHIAKFCKESAAIPKETACIIIKNQPQKQVKRIEITNQYFNSIIDTGSDLSLISLECYKKIGCPALSEGINFDGLGALNNNTRGSFIADVVIDDGKYKITFHVVGNEIMKHAVLIGADFLNLVELRSVKGRVTIHKIPEKSIDTDSLPEVLKVDVVETADSLDFSYIFDKDARREVEIMVKNYEPKKTREVSTKMTLVLKDDIPVYQKPRRLSLLEQTEVNKQLKVWLDDGIIRSSDSEYASPIVLVKKRNGDTRICIDFRKLNQKIIKDRYPLPRIDDQLDRLQDAKIFSTLDLKNGFFHVEVAEESRKYTSFIIPTGQYEFMRMPFGLCNSPAVFQKFINAVFKELIFEGIVLTYMDDLIIPSSNIKQAVDNLRRVIEVSSQAGLHINWQKCKFFQTEIEYLGHIIVNGVIKPSGCKSNAVMKFPVLRCVRDVQSFIGLTSYFRKFIHRYSIIARPLTNLLRKNVEFKFGKEEEHAFRELKIALSNKPVLRLYKVKAETELHTDASKSGFGAILLQKDSSDNVFYPVYYASGKTSPIEERYTSYELEVLAIIKALKKFRVYLLGIHFKIITDCKAFTQTMNKKDLCIRVARWALALEEYDYEIQHRPAKNMMHVDALSRNPLPEILLINENDDSLIFRLKKAQHADQDLQKIIRLATFNKADGYQLRNDLLYRDYDNELLLVVPKLLQASVIRQAHEQGHFGVNKTEILVRRDYWFKDMRSKIEKIIKSCINCILAERKQGKQEGFLNTIDKGNVPLHTYHVDHLGPLPSTKKCYRHIFVVVDAFSKFIWLYATKSTDAAEVIDRLGKQSIVFGNPYRIVSDRGTAFTSNLFKDYCIDEKIQHLLITTGIPRGNGQVERINRVLIPLLTKLSAPKPEEWFKYLDVAQKYINVTLSRSTGRTPFQLMFGIRMRLKEDVQLRELIESEWARMFEDERDDIREKAREKIAEIQQENLKSFNKKRTTALKYKDGDLVAIKRTQFGPGLKFRNKYLGPYCITKVMRNDRYAVTKIGEHEGPQETSTSADFMKPWLNFDDVDEIESEIDETDNNCKSTHSRTNVEQDGRDVGLSK